MDKIFLVLFLVSISAVFAQYAECPSSCECMSSPDFMEQYHRAYSLDDLCNGRDFVQCGYDIRRYLPQYCFRIPETPDEEPPTETETGSGHVDLGRNNPDDHGWYYDPNSNDIWNEMLQLKVTAGTEEDIELGTITLHAFGSGDDSKDISRIEIYLDLEGNGIVDHSDMKIGSADPAYKQDNGEKKISVNLDMKKESERNIIIAYIMSSSAPVNKTYGFTVENFTAKGKVTKTSFGLGGLPLNSSLKTIISAPPPKCNGSVTFDLDQTIVAPETRITGTIGGLKNCENKTGRVQNIPCNFAAASRCYCTIGAMGCGCGFNAPPQKGNYTYYGCVDIDSDNIIDSGENASAKLAVYLNETIISVEPECHSDDECSGIERCSNGNCTQVAGQCGYAMNHTWVKYECGLDFGCKSCAVGRCENHKCVVLDMHAPDSTTLGKNVTVSVLKNGKNAAGEQVTVIDPNGYSLSAMTNNTGEVSFVPQLVGVYKVSISGGAQGVISRNVDVGKGSDMEGDIVSRVTYFLFNEPMGKIILFFLGLIVVLSIYLTRKRKKIPKPEEQIEREGEEERIGQ